MQHTCPNLVQMSYKRNLPNSLVNKPTSSLAEKTCFNTIISSLHSYFPNHKTIYFSMVRPLMKHRVLYNINNLPAITTMPLRSLRHKTYLNQKAQNLSQSEYLLFIKTTRKFNYCPIF